MTGLQLQLEGVRRVTLNNVNFVGMMRSEAVWLCTKYGNVSADDLREFAARRHVSPSNQNAWGAIFRGKRWRRIGEKKSTWPSNHARRIGVYQLRHA